MSFVIEKDQRIYELECETKLLKEENGTLRSTTVTDETLLHENQELQSQIRDIQEEKTQLQQTIVTIQEENSRLKKKVLELYANPRIKDTPEPGCVFDLHSIKKRLHQENIQRVDQMLLEIVLKYHVTENQWIPRHTMEMILKDILSGCKILSENQ
jgi:hypothetical protein